MPAAMSPQDLAFAITRTVQQAQSNRELDQLAGEVSECDWFAELIEVLERGRKQVIEMRDHRHAWVLFDDGSDAVRCAYCGASGDV